MMDPHHQLEALPTDLFSGGGSGGADGADIFSSLIGASSSSADSSGFNLDGFSQPTPHLQEHHHQVGQSPAQQPHFYQPLHQQETVGAPPFYVVPSEEPKQELHQEQRQDHHHLSSSTTTAMEAPFHTMQPQQAVDGPPAHDLFAASGGGEDDASVLFGGASSSSASFFDQLASSSPSPSNGEHFFQSKGGPAHPPPPASVPSPFQATVISPHAPSHPTKDFVPTMMTPATSSFPNSAMPVAMMPTTQQQHSGLQQSQPYNQPPHAQAQEPRHVAASMGSAVPPAAEQYQQVPTSAMHHSAVQQPVTAPVSAPAPQVPAVSNGPAFPTEGSHVQHQQHHQHQHPAQHHQLSSAVPAVPMSAPAPVPFLNPNAPSATVTPTVAVQAPAQPPAQPQRENGGEELPPDIFGASGDSFFDSLGGGASAPAAGASFFDVAAAAAAPTPALSGSQSQFVQNPAPTVFNPSAGQPVGVFVPSSSPVNSQSSAPAQSHRPPNIFNPAAMQKPPSSTGGFVPVQPAGPSVFTPSVGQSSSTGTAHQQAGVPAASWNTAPKPVGAGTPVTLFTPQPPGSQGRSASGASSIATSFSPYPQPPATAPLPYGVGHPGPGFGRVGPSPPGSAGAVAFNLSAPGGVPSPIGPAGHQPQSFQGPNPLPTPSGSGSVNMFVPRPSQPTTPTPPSSQGHHINSTAASPYGASSTPAGPVAIPSDRLSSSASGLQQRPQVDPYGRSALTQSAPMPQPGVPHVFVPGVPAAHPGQAYHPQSHHNRTRSVTVGTGGVPPELQFVDMPRVASQPELQGRVGLMTPPGSNVHTGAFTFIPNMSNGMQPQYGYPEGYGHGQMNVGMHQPTAWGDMSYPASGSMYMQQQQPMSQDRLLFDRPHAIATFGFGGKLFTLIPQRKRLLNVYGQASQTEQKEEYTQGPVKIHPINELLSKNSFMSTFTNFPGPLLNASKDAVTKYISSKASGEAESEDAMADPEATQLLWSLLKVMCTHYGDLGQQEAVKDTRQILMDGINPADYPAATQAAHSQLTGSALESATKQMEALLLSGEREKACQIAMDTGMWSHALFLASHLNPQLYQAACKRFAQSVLSEGSPLQTLYFLLAKCPQELLKSLQGAPGTGTIVDRWRENLAVILANRVQGDVKVIGQLGDMLWSTQMRVAAAHFCYLVAETPFGPFENPNTRLILIGGDHKTQARLFVSPESLQRTEIFEYAKALGNSQYTLPSLQVYKLIYAMILADLGLLQQASNYYQSISSIVKDSASSCSPAFLAQLHSFGDRISKIAPASRKAALAPPSWLSGLVQKGISALIGDDKNDIASKPIEQQVEVVSAIPTVPTVSTVNPVPTVSMVTSVPGAVGVPSPLPGPGQPLMVNPAAMMAPAGQSPYAPTFGAQQPQNIRFPGVAVGQPGAPSPYQPQMQPQVQPPQHHQQPDYEEEDLMRAAFTKKEATPAAGATLGPSQVAMEKKAPPKEEPQESKESDKKNDDAANAGLWGRLGGLFRKKQGKEMRLGQEENEFVYNEELGIWHEKGKPPTQETRDAVAPPPILTRSSSAPTGGPTSSPFPGAAPPPSGGNQFTRFASPSRGRYVDTFNPNGAAPVSTGAPSIAMPMPSPLGVNPSAYNVFTPPGTPMNPHGAAGSPFQPQH